MNNKGGRPAKGNDNRVTVRLSDDHLATLQMYASKVGLSDKTNSEAIRNMIDAESKRLRGAPADEINVEEVQGHLDKLRDIQTNEALVAEINEARRLLSDTTWKNVAYNPSLYKTREEKKAVADALKESSDIIHDLFYSLAERIVAG